MIVVVSPFYSAKSPDTLNKNANFCPQFFIWFKQRQMKKLNSEVSSLWARFYLRKKTITYCEKKFWKTEISCKVLRGWNRWAKFRVTYENSEKIQVSQKVADGLKELQKIFTGVCELIFTTWIFFVFFRKLWFAVVSKYIYRDK